MKFLFRFILFNLIFVTSNTVSNAQLEQNTWFFGGGTTNTRPGIRFDFLTNQPIQFNEVRYPLGLQENNIIISNPNTGEVILYSDGQLVIDATNNPMPNGTDLNGSPSAMYGTSIVFDPSGCDRYFLVTVQSEEDAIPRKVYYSAIDLSMAGNGSIANPLGDVDNSVKNIDFTPGGVDIAEGIFAIPKSGNTKDSWLFFGDRRQRELYLYQVTSSGISFYDSFDLKTLLPTLPAGQIFNVKMDFFPLSNTTGRLIIAPGRNTNQDIYPVGSFVFNTETGAIDQSSYQLIDENTLWTYGTAFSPDGSKLYLSDYIGKTLKQFDYNTNTLTRISISPHSGRTGGIKTGPDGKTYWANVFVNNGSSPASNLSTINRPNQAGLACDLSLNNWAIGANINPRLIGALPSFGTFPSPPFVLAISPDDCGLGNGSAIIDPAGSLPPLQYQWDNGETSATAVNLIGGLHQATITDGQGCEKVLEVMIEEENDIITPEITGDLSICKMGNTATSLAGQDGFDSYLWSTGDTTQSIFVFTPGTYSLIVTNEGVCSGEVSVEVIEESLDVEISGDSILCSGINEITTLAVDADFVEYLWSDQSNEATLMVNQAGIYSITVSNSDGCLAEDTIEIVASTPPDVSILGSTSICEIGNNTTSLEASPSFETYLWSNGETSQNIEADAPGFYSVTVSDAIGCTNATSVQIVQEILSINLGDDLSFCPENFEPIILDAGSGFLSYLWSDQSTEQSLSIMDAGMYFVEVTNENGCIAIDSVIISLAPSPQTSILGENSFCEFGDTTSILDAGDNFETYIWSNGETTQIIEVDLPGIYSVTISNEDNCLGEASIEVIEETVSVQISGRDFICLGTLDTIELEASSGFESYLWSSGALGQMLNVIETGQYTVTATNSNGCVAIDSISIGAILAPQIVDLPSVIEIEFDESITLIPEIIANPPFTIQWTPDEYLSCQDCQSPTIVRPLDNQIYQILIQDDYGCIDSASVSIRLIFDKNVFSPNVFSPNGDGSNDGFTIYGTPSLKQILKLQIFDRWGELVFENLNFSPNEESLGWNGEFNGKVVDPAVFVWLANVEFFDGSITTLKGDLVVIR